MTAEEYAIERLINLDKENSTLKNLNGERLNTCNMLRNTCDKLQDINSDLKVKLEEIKQLIILTLNNESDLSSGILLCKEDAQELIKILGIKVEWEVPDEDPED